MTTAADLPAEPQYEPAPADSVSEGESAAAATLVSIERQTAPPETGELLGRVASEISQAFHSSLAQVVSDIGREYGVETGKAAWMEKGGATGAIASEQLHGKEPSDGSELSNDMHRILRELQTSRLEVHELQQVVDELRDEQRLARQRVALYSSLSTKLKRELVDERLALLDAQNKIKELRRSRSGDDTGSSGARSPHSPSLKEQHDNLWSSPNKPMAGPTSGSSGTGPSGQASTGSSLMTFNFFPSRGEGGHNGDDEEPPSPSSSTQTLRNTLMGQFLPSSLLDSPQITPKHARSFAGSTLSEEKVPPFLSEFKGNMESLSLVTPPFAEHLTSSSMDSGRFEPGDGRKETSQSEGERFSTVSPEQISILSELFDGISVGELETILRRFNGQESAAIDHILHTHPSFNPMVRLGGKAESSSGMASMTSLSPSRSAMIGHNKTNLHRSGSQSGPSGPPGTSNNWKTEICMYYMQGKCNKTRRTCSFAHGEGDLVRPSGPSNTGVSNKSGQNFKTRLCQAYEAGTCTKSRRDCPMAHGVNDLRDLRDSGAGSGSSGAQPILQATTPRLQSYKTELCYYFLKGNCNYSKDECRFAHGQSDLRTVESNTAHMVAAAAGTSGYGGEYPTSPLPPPPSIEKQLQLQHQYQQQYHQHHQPPAIAQPPHNAYPPQLPLAPPQQSFVPQHQLQMHLPSRGSGGYQHQQYDIAQQQQNPYMPTSGQFRYMKSMEEKRPASGGRPPPRRDSGSSWSSFDASVLPPPEY